MVGIGRSLQEAPASHAAQPRPVMIVSEFMSFCRVLLALVLIAIPCLSGCVDGNSGSERARPIRLGIVDGPIETGLSAFGCFTIYQKSTEAPASSHGTSVASVVLGSTGECNVDLAESLELYSYPVLDIEGSRPTGDVISEAIDQACLDGVDILNVSIDLWTDSDALRESVDEAVSSGMIIVAAAGNRLGLRAGYPASYEGVISVGSTTLDGEVAATSALHGVDVFINGTDQPALDARGNQIRQSGTSIAAARITLVLIDTTLLDSGSSGVTPATVGDALRPYRLTEDQ